MADCGGLGGAGQASIFSGNWLLRTLVVANARGRDLWLRFGAEEFEKDVVFLIVPCIMGLFGFFLMKKLIWDLVDEVYDDGESLLIRNHGEEERVALSNIMNVSATTFMNPPRTTLRAVKPGKFGDEITFIPVTSFTLNPFVRSQVVEDLIVSR